MRLSQIKIKQASVTGSKAGIGAISLVKNVGDSISYNVTLRNNGGELGFARLVLNITGLGTNAGPLVNIPTGTSVAVTGAFSPSFKPGNTYPSTLFANESTKFGDFKAKSGQLDFSINIPGLPPPPPSPTIPIVLRVPTGIDTASPGNIGSENLINSGNLGPFLKSVSWDGASAIKANSSQWASIWTQNISFMTFNAGDVDFLVNQLPSPLPFDMIPSLVSSAILNT